MILILVCTDTARSDQPRWKEISERQGFHADLCQGQEWFDEATWDKQPWAPK